MRVFAFDQNGSPVTFGSSNYTLYASSVISFNGVNQFSSPASSSTSANESRGRVSIRFNNQYVSSVRIEYYDIEDGGAYTIANIAGVSICAQNDALGNVSQGGSTTASVFANDFSSTGVASSSANTDVSLTNLGGLTGATINANGTINIPANATPGSYTLTYRICSPTGQTSFCTTATASLTVLACQAGTAAPFLIAGGFYDATNSAYRIPCGSTTANLSTISSNNKPTPATVTLTWHTGTPATTANKIASTIALTGTTKYYASFFDSVANCYSPTKEIMVFAPICGRNNDFTSISITAGVGGTLPSIFANDSYNGLIITDISTITAKYDYELWTPSNAIINNNGTLTIPADVLPGIYTYYYKLVDTDPDIGILINQASNIEVKFRVSPNTDGDPYNDYTDWDDDNDGILDAVESPPCFYSSTEASIIENVTSPFEGAMGDPLVGETISTLFNGNSSDVNPFNFTGQTITSGSPIFTISYPAMIRLTSLSVNQAASGMAPANRFGRLFGSNDGVNFTAISAATGVALNSATVTFAVTSTTSYRFYEIRYVGTVAAGNLTDGTLGTANIQEITAVYNLLAYEPSANPKPITCTFSTDSDGVPNHLDVDSDGDNCFDAIEGDENVTAGNVDGNGRITGGVDANGVPNLVNLLGAADTGGDVGQGIGFSQISTITECLDTDGDSIPDACDLDDDNDGILDLNENSCALTGQTIRIGYIPNARDLDTDNGYTFDGAYMNGSGALKLTNAANFGPSGIVNTTFVLVNMGTAPITKTLINSLNLNVIFLGGINDLTTSYLTTAEFDAIKDWSDDSLKNIVVATQFQTIPWGAGITAANLNPNVPTALGGQTSIFNGPFGNVNSFTQGGSFQAHFSSINSVCSISPLAVDGNNRAVIYVDGAYNDIMIADVDILTTIGSVTSGSAITSNNDRVFANFWAFVAQQSACADKDTDGDTIPDRLDLDADNDGCPDAIEGSSTTITPANLVNSAIPGGNTGATSGAYNLPVIQNLGNTVNTSVTSESYGVPTIAGTGQAIGTSQTANPVLNAGTAGSNQSIISGSSPAALTLTGSSGVIQWQVSTDNVTFNNIPSATAATYAPGTLTATRYYRAIITSVGGCTSTSNVVTITVNAFDCIGKIYSLAGATGEIRAFTDPATSGALGTVVNTTPYPQTPASSANGANAMGYSNLTKKFYYVQIQATAPGNNTFVSYDPATNLYETLAGTTGIIYRGTVTTDGAGYYAITNGNILKYYSIANNTWTTITSTYVDQNGVSLNSLLGSYAGGDIAMDGNGDLWILAGQGASPTAYVFRAKSTVPTTSMGSTPLVLEQIVKQDIGSSPNGIAFSPTGQLYITNVTTLFRMNDDFTISAIGTISPAGGGGDLASCAFPVNPFAVSDFGDAPDTYKTFLASDGPRHTASQYDATTNTSSLMIGSTVDLETDGIPNVNANGDDLSNVNDENSISITTLFINSTSYTTAVPVVNNTGGNATLRGWIDFNKNGIFDSSESATVTVPNGATSASLTWTGLSGLTAGDTYYRLRIAKNAADITLPTGSVFGGEVEDGKLTIQTVCYEDPTLVAGATYPVKHGITLLGRAGKINVSAPVSASDWPMVRNSAYTALESKTKGFVVTRNSSPETTITVPVVGMMVFDTDENAGAGCLKIYTGAGAGEGWKCFSTQGCP
ncbi:beta strand repeat-containing protein [Chryseobacterium caseinilyticum]|uniref:GEVED domain-containing protein n=1 Tax=Chryseobacterium caseinilyticum TaxID=2771428 RepID=A0ABR8ZF62_9FLAO|nr:GEVED domain-containing protein [Chryseobacterium caseinilyticum]MBD8083946.1 hypothetical protein [Chryseobacterium caseinilyticum]